MNSCSLLLFTINIAVVNLKKKIIRNLGETNRLSLSVTVRNRKLLMPGLLVYRMKIAGFLGGSRPVSNG